MFTALAQPLKHHPWFSAFAFLIALTLWGLPYGIKLGIEKALLAQGAEQVNIGDIDLNLFTAQLRIEKLQIHHAQRPALTIGQLDAAWRWRDWLQQHWMLQNVHLQNTELHLQQRNAETLLIGGLTVPLTPAESEQAGSATLPALGMAALTFDQVSLHIHPLNQASSRYHIHKLTLNDLYSWQTRPAALILHSDLNGARFNAHLQLDLFSEQPKIVGTVKTQQVDLAKLPVPETFKATLPGLSGLLTTDLTFTLQNTDQGVRFDQQGELRLEQLALTLAPLEAQTAALHWSGGVRYNAQNQQLTLLGTLQLEKLRLHDSVQALTLQQSAQAQLNLSASLTPDALTLQQQGKLQISQLQLQQADTRVALKHGHYTGLLKMAQHPERTDLTLDGQLVADALDLQQATQRLQQNVQSSLQLQASLSADGVQIDQTGTLQLQNLHWQQTPLQAALQSLQWQGTARYAQRAENAPQIALQGQIQAKNLSAASQQQPLLDLAALSVHNITLNNLDDLQLTQLELQQLVLPDEPQPPFVSLGRLQIDHAGLRNLNRLTLGNVRLQNTHAQIEMEADHQIAQLKRLLSRLNPESPESPTAETPPQTPSDTAAKTPAGDFHYRVENIKLDGANPITITLKQFAEPIVKTFHLERLNLGTLDSDQPQTDTPLELAARIDEFSRLSSQGTVQPLNPVPNVNLQSRLEGLDLVSFSPASRDFVGYDVASGQLSANLVTHIQDNRIDAQNDLKLSKLELKSADADKSAEFQKGLSMPLDAALGLLRDKNDNIKLKLPVTGDLSQPDFDLQHVINTALAGAMKTATRTYLLLALQPFGAIALAGNYLTDQAGAIHLQPIDFAGGEATLNSEMQTYLQKIAQLLNDKRKIQIKVCSIANEYDRQLLLHKQTQTTAKTDKTAQNSLQPATIGDDALLNLATERGNQIKRELLQAGVKTEQVILCQPRLEAERSPPKVTLGI